MDGMQFSREATRPVSELPVRLTRERLLPRADTRAAQRRLQAVPAQLDSNGRQLFLHLAVPVERGLIDTGIRVEDLGELVLVHGLVLASQVRKSRACGRTRPDRCGSCDPAGTRSNPTPPSTAHRWPRSPRSSPGARLGMSACRSLVRASASARGRSADEQSSLRAPPSFRS